MTERSPHALRVFVNAVGVDVPPGSTVLDAVRAFDADAAEALREGSRIVTDSRGLPVASTAGIHAGSIFRLVSKRRGADAERDGGANDHEAE